MDDITTASWIIRISVGLLMVIFGLSQFLRPEPWLRFVPKWLQALLPLKPEHFMRLHALGNLTLGVWVISGMWPVLAVIAAGVWFLSIIPFALLEDFHVGLRDAVILASLAALLLLVK